MPAQAKRAPRPDFTIASEPALSPAPPAFGAYGIGDLTSAFQCRYPFAEPGRPTRYCGKPTAPRPSGLKSSWCCDHLPVVFDLTRTAGRASPGKGRA